MEWLPTALCVRADTQRWYPPLVTLAGSLTTKISTPVLNRLALIFSPLSHV